MQQLDDTILIELAVNKNDQRAYGELVNRHQSNLRYSMRQLTDWNETLADDLVQDAFVQAFKQLHKFRNKAKFSSWLYRIGYNTFLQHVRKKQLITESIDDQPLAANDSLISNDANEDSDARSDLHQRVAKLLSQIEPERRSVLHLFLHRQHTQQEISDIMGIPLGSVKTHISRGRKALQSNLHAWQG
ncbi:MAG: RNA polymerase sigma factor [Gammaproteobacteria bacterium]|nr:RNA polymerase sigma factor [Gammaproteobacteria bacterium]